MMCWRGAGRYFVKAPAGSVKSPYNSCKTSILHTPDQSACFRFLGGLESGYQLAELFLQGNPESCNRHLSESGGSLKFSRYKYVVT